MAVPRDGTARQVDGWGPSQIVGKHGQVWLRHVVVVASYVVLALALTWPLFVHFTTHVPGDGGDDPALVWNLWWVRHSLLRGMNPFDCQFIFHPIGINLAFYTLTVLNGCLSIPLQGIIGLVATSNLLLISSYVLSGYGAYLLVLDTLGDRQRPDLAAWLGGVIYAFAAPKVFYAALGQFNIASSQWVPFAALYMLRAIRWSKPRDIVLAAMFISLQAWAEMTYASFLLVLLVVMLAWRVLSLRDGAYGGALSRSARPVFAGVAVVGVFLILISPILANMVPDLLCEGDFTVVGGGFADVFSADLVGFFLPTMLHPTLGHLVRDVSSFVNYDKGQHVYFGYTVTALTLIGLARPRGRCRHLWLLAGGVFFLLCLGPELHINGRSHHLPMPFEVLQALPFFKANRYPSRYAVMLALALSVLSAGGFDSLTRVVHRKTPVLGMLAASLFIIENLSVPLPLSDMTIPSIYGRVRRAAGDFAVLEVPIGWRNGFRITGAHDVSIMFSQYYQTWHEKRLLGGNTSRNPEFKFQYLSEMPVLQTLVALEAGREVPESLFQEDRRQASEVLGALGVRYLVVHSPPAGTELVRYVEEVLPTKLLESQGGARLYAVDVEQRFGELDLRIALAEGWGCRMSPAVAERSRARVLIPGGPGRVITLTVRGFGDESELRVLGRSGTVATCSVTSAWSECSFTVPPSLLPTEELWLMAARRWSPEQLVGHRTIGATGVVSPVHIYVRSAGEEFGDFAHIYIDGREESPNSRGYNVVVLDPGTGRVLDRRTFDTHLDETASSSMAAYLSSVPRGSIVILAVADEASRLLGEDAVAALRSIGAAGDLRGCFRCAHVIVGVKDAPAGTAAEVIRDIGVAEAVVGKGLSEPGAYFELKQIRVEP